MELKSILLTYIHYLIHPFKTHELLSDQSISSDKESLRRISVYDSLGISWVFIILNGLVRIALLNSVLILFQDLITSTSFDFSEILDFNNYNQFYFLIFSIILDVIFYPLFGFFLIQFWEVIFNFYGKLLKTPGDIGEKAQTILSVSFSSHMFKIIPVFGGMAQTISSLISVYAGLRVQFRASPMLSLCIMMTPFLIMLGVLTFIVFLFAFIS